MSDPTPLSKLHRLVTAGEFVVTAEIGPPKHASAEGMTRQAALLKDCVDAVNVTDNQAATVRLSSIAAAVHLAGAGLEPVVQMTTRDRNRIALQSDLLGAYSLGIRNVLCLSGDHVSLGNHPGTRNVFDLDSVQLVAMVHMMRERKQFLCGEPIKGQEPRFFTGAVANPFADPFEFRVRRLEKKINAGAQFIQTQAVFDLERFERWMALVRERDLHRRAAIIPGVIPLKSLKAARYLQQSVPGMVVPDVVAERLERAEDTRAEGIRLCIEQIRHLRSIEGVAGIHIMAVLWAEAVGEIVAGAGLLPRQG